MNRINKTFNTLKHKNEKALVGFVTAGDPDYERSLKSILSMCANGLDVLELGIPFSDPTADGPVIQRSSARAIEKGMTLTKGFEMVKAIRAHTQIPIVLFSYYNPILKYGVEAFYKSAQEVGVDGVLVVDLPPEESNEMTQFWAPDSLSLIRLIAPTTPKKRMADICDNASGFIYAVSKTGVTGSAGIDFSEIEDLVTQLCSVTTLPICVGFGISTQEHVQKTAQIADGVVIGSAFEKIIEENLEDESLPDILGARIAQLKKNTLF